MAPRRWPRRGEHADGYIPSSPTQILEWTVAAVRAAESAGRDPDDVEICVVAPAYVGDDLAHQRDQLRWFEGMVGNHVVDMVNRYGEDREKVPQVLPDYIKARGPTTTTITASRATRRRNSCLRTSSIDSV